MHSCTVCFCEAREHAQPRATLVKYPDASGASWSDAYSELPLVVQAWRTMNCLTVVTGYALIRKASDQTEGCSGPTRYLLMVTDLCFSQKGENPVF